MKWWTETAWPWLKKNWQWLLFPVGILLFFAGRFSKPAEVITVAPTREADERARVEAARRQAELTAERDRLQARLDEVRKENENKLRELTYAQAREVDRLQNDPEALNAFLRSL